MNIQIADNPVTALPLVLGVQHLSSVIGFDPSTATYIAVHTSRMKLGDRQKLGDYPTIIKLYLVFKFSL